MKEKLFLPTNATGDLWLYNKERFLDLTYQSFLHRHDEIEMNLVTWGHGVYILDNRKVELLPNTIIWLFPEQEHLLLDKSLDFEMWILVLRPEYLRTICSDPVSKALLQSDPEAIYCRSLPTPLYQKINDFCKDALAVRNNLALFNISMGYILLQAWSAYQAANGAANEKVIHPAVERAARLILDSEGMDDLPSLARQVGLSPTGLSRQFKKQMGLSLTDFRNRCRVEHFIDLYANGQTRTLLSAALEAGFGSYAQFYRVFRKIMGSNPADYRRSKG